MKIGGIQKQKLLVIALILCFLLGMGVFTVYGQEQSASMAQEPITMDVAYGFDNTAKGGRYVPVTITLTNGDSVTFSGQVQILSMEASYEIYRYDYPVSVEQDSTAAIQMNIPFGAGSDQLFVVLTDDSGKEIMRKRLKMNVSQEVPEMFIGILSDMPERLAYLNGIGISYGALKTRTFTLQAENMPEEEIGLDLLDVILVSNYRMRNLSETQTRAIMDWVRNGGILIMGTGMRVEDTLGRFAPELLDESYGIPAVIPVDMGTDYAVKGPTDAMIHIPCVEIALHGGSVILSNDGFPILSAAAKEKGLIAVAAYDFVDIADFCQSQPSYVDDMFTSLLGENRINQLATYLYSGNSNEFWSVQSMINTGNVDKLPNVIMYTIIIIVYIGLVGPGLYLFLKKREMRKHYRLGTMVLALGFTGLIYLLGGKTRFQNTFFTYATIQDMNEDVISESTYINMRNPYNKPYSVKLNPSYSVRPITRSYRYDMTPAVKFKGEEGYSIDINHEPDVTTVSAQNVIAFNPRYFQLDRKSVNTQKAGIVGEIRYFEGTVSGYVRNELDYSVENAAIILYGHLILLDELKPGETKDLAGAAVLNTPLDYSYAVAELVSGGYQYDKADINDKRYMLTVERTSLLMFYLDNYMSGYSPDARVVAFSQEKTDNQFLLEGTYDTYGLTMLTSSIEVNPYRDRMIYRSGLMRTPTVVSGSYNTEGNSMYGIEPVTLEYYLGNDLDIEKMSFTQLSPEFLGNNHNYRITPFTGSRYFYNYNTGTYDRIDVKKQSFGKEDLVPYLSPGNTITIKYLYDNSNGSNWEITLPMLMIVGREK